MDLILEGQSGGDLEALLLTEPSRQANDKQPYTDKHATGITISHLSDVSKWMVNTACDRELAWFISVLALARRPMPSMNTHLAASNVDTTVYTAPLTNIPCTSSSLTCSQGASDQAEAG